MDHRIAFGLAFSLAGLCVGLGGVKKAANARRLSRHASRTIGRVKSIRIDPADENTSVEWHYPTVIFPVGKGRKVEVQLNDAFVSGKIRIGDRLPLAFEPGHPETARLATRIGRDGIAEFVLGLLFAIIGGLILWAALRAAD